MAFNLLSFILLGFIAFSIYFEQSFLINQFLVTGQVGDTQIFSSIFAGFSFLFLTLVLIKTKAFRFPKTVSLFFVLFIIWSLVSTFGSKDIGTSLYQILRLFAYFALFLGVYNLIRTNKKIDNFLIVGFAIVGSLILIRDLFNFVLSGDLLLGKQFRGSFFWHNQMAGFLLFLIPVLLSLFFYFKKPFAKTLVLIAVSISLFAMVVTYSRGGWLSIFLGLIIYVLIILKNVKINLGSIIIIPVIILVSFAILPNVDPVKKRIDDLRADLSTQRTASGSLRVTVWQNSLKMVSDFPIFGVGSGAFGSAYYKYQTDPWLYARNTHNYFLEIAAETGIVGSILFTTLLLLVVLATFKNKDEVLDVKKRPLIVGVAIALLASIFHAFLDIDFSRISLFAIFWVFLAILTANFNRDQSSLNLKGSGRLLYIPVIVLLLASLILLVSERSYLNAQKKLVEGNMEGAKNNIRRATMLNPFDWRLYLLSGQINEVGGVLDGAKADYQMSYNLSPYLSSPLFRLAIVALKEDDVGKSIELLKQAIEINPYSDPNYYAVLADLYLRTGDVQTAKNILRSAIFDRFPTGDVFSQIEHRYNLTGFKKDLALLYLKLIELNLREGNNEEAEILLLTLERKIDPQNPEIPQIKRYLESI